MLQLQAGLGLRDQLIDNQARIDHLMLEQARLATELDESGDWEREGFNSAIDWLRFNCHVTSTVAADLVNVGHQLPWMNETVVAMNAGDIGFAHVKVMARTADAVGEQFDETKLLRLARENSPGKFHYTCLHYRHSVDANRYADDQARQAEARELYMTTTEDGCLIVTATLDPVGGAIFRSALEPLARKSESADTRRLPQRYADALVELASNGTKVQMQVTSSVETLLGIVGAPGAENEFSLPISSKTVERWACDCSLSRVLLQDSVVIDVGRSERTIKGPRRRALVARDRHCRWPGCDRPAAWCDGHHVIHWLDGGGSDIENQVLLCRRHHWLVHEGRWQLVKNEAGDLLPIAPTISFGLARGPD